MKQLSIKMWDYVALDWIHAFMLALTSLHITLHFQNVKNLWQEAVEVVVLIFLNVILF